MLESHRHRLSVQTHGTRSRGGPMKSLHLSVLELLSFFPWRKDTLSDLAEHENLTHTYLLWL